MSGTTEMGEVPDRELSESLGALRSAVRSLRDEAGRVTAALDGVAHAIDEERRLEGEALDFDQEPSAEAAAPSRPVGVRTTASERIPDPGDEDQTALWVSGLLCALALIVSVALLKVELAVAVPVVLIAAVLLQMKWWMPALAAVALGLALAIESPSGSMADKVAAMCVVFVLTAGALLLYEIWQRLHLRLQA